MFRTKTQFFDFEPWARVKKLSGYADSVWDSKWQETPKVEAMKNRLRLSAQNLRNRIAQVGIKKGELAHQIGITPETLSRWLAGKVEYIDEGMLIKLSEKLECDISDLSPERTPSRHEVMPIQSFEKIAGDEFLRMGLYSGDWKSLLTLVQNEHTQNALRDSEISIALAQIFQNAYDLSTPDSHVVSHSREIVYRNYEKFDILARACLAQGIVQLLSNNAQSSATNFKRAIVQSQTEWVLALASLLAGFAEAIHSQTPQYWLNLANGLHFFEKSTDDLTGWVSANAHLIITQCCVLQDLPGAMNHLAKAKSIFQNLGMKHGYVRCASYDLLCLAAQRNLTDFTSKQEEVMSIMQKLPRLYKFESLMICSYAFSIINNAELAIQYLGIADELSEHNPTLRLIVKRRMLELVPDSAVLSAEVDSLEQGAADVSQTQKWWMA